MRYIKVLILAAFFFLALLFFFQNQASLSQEIQLNMNLFFLPPFTSIPLPFYFIVLGAFLIGCLLAIFLLAWDKLTTSTKLVKTRWQLNSTQAELARVKKQMGANSANAVTADAGKEQAEEKA